ncbi:hypothetical protein RHGRI_005393 [Rhododendron griersonianum]|uniref:KHA domain-containing protein n=1 Tax=Rhododendron griersonianum TaxID=479676 RepID=A0AAV6LD54_9ERIC|nr:hypothetical protein RHGRI_005393 [Rhododendron griersonianum]
MEDAQLTKYKNIANELLRRITKWKIEASFLSRLGAAEMAGEIGVILNIPQPFTVRTKRLSQYLKGLKKEMLEEIPFVTELLDDFNTENIAPIEGAQYHEAPNSSGDANIEGTSPTSVPSSDILPVRVIIHGHHPDDRTNDGDKMGKLIHLPDSMEDVLSLAEKKFGKRGCTILAADGSQVEELGALRENDHLFIF